MTNANIGALALNSQNMIAPANNAGMAGTAAFTVGTSPITLVQANPQIQKVIFHNPGTEIIYVCQPFDIFGNPVTAGLHPGNWAIFPGATLTFTGNGAAGAWNAAAANGSSNPFTMALSQTI